MSSKGRGVKTTKNGSITESSDNSRVVKKSIQSIKNVSFIWTVGILLTLIFLHSMIIKFLHTTFFQSRFPLPWLYSSTSNNLSLPEISTWNFSLSNLLNLNLSWFDISNWGSFIWNSPMTDVITWDASKNNAETLKIGATTLESSMDFSNNRRELTIEGVEAFAYTLSENTTLHLCRKYTFVNDDTRLNKIGEEGCQKEMTEEKELDPNIADRIGEYVKLKGNKELLDKLFLDQSLISNNNTKTGLNDMVLLFKYLEIFGVLDKVFLAKKISQLSYNYF
ncbi:hypothetical protein C2G38_2233088 [Gigaspora rosea]|uniref:Uncharacterized protein n=1 Tax=Gigaspora rosea TaxID=44941 RepID=A0A397TSI3_9GLOM|nr:hypothetical protein C2G38_2233088 [Gigaspora rosea]